MRRIRITGLPKAQEGGQMGTATHNTQHFPWPGKEGGRRQDPDVSIAKYLKPVPKEEGTVEAEKDEVVMVPTEGGIPATFIVGGKRHSNGGTALKLPADSFVFSDTKDMRIKDPEILIQFNMAVNKSGYTPATIAKKYLTQKYHEILRDPHSDDRQKETAEKMISNSNIKLAKLALIQEAKKGFPTGIPRVSIPYMEMMDIDPTMFFNGPEQEQSGPMYAQDGLNVPFLNNPAMGPYSPETLDEMNNPIQFDPQANPFTGPADVDITGKRKFDYQGDIMASAAITGMRGAANFLNADERANAEAYRKAHSGALSAFESVEADRGSYLSGAGNQGVFRPTEKVPVQYRGRYGKGGETKTIKIKALPEKQRGGTVFPYGPTKAKSDEMKAWLDANLESGASPSAVEMIGPQKGDILKGYGIQGTYEDWASGNPQFLKYFKEKHGRDYDSTKKEDLLESEEFYNDHMFDTTWNYAYKQALAGGMSDSEARDRATELAGLAVENMGYDFNNDNKLNSADQMFGDYHRSRREIKFKDLPPAKQEAVEEAAKDETTPTGQAAVSPKSKANAPWWAQDMVRGLGAAADFWNIEKYNPFIAKPNLHLPDVTFYDPERELAASSEMIAQGVQGLSNFSSPQAYGAVFNQIQGQGFRNAADIMARYNNLNVGTANQHEMAIAGMLNQHEQLNAKLDTDLYDRYTIANQQFDNAKNMARQEMRQSYMDALTNRATTQALNSIFENYSVDPMSGGMVHMTGERPITPTQPTDIMKERAKAISNVLKENPWMRENPALAKQVIGDFDESDYMNSWDKEAMMMAMGAGAYPKR